MDIHDYRVDDDFLQVAEQATVTYTGHAAIGKGGNL